MRLHRRAPKASMKEINNSFFFKAEPYDMWDLSSPNRKQTCDPCIGSVES